VNKQWESFNDHRNLRTDLNIHSAVRKRTWLATGSGGWMSV